MRVARKKRPPNDGVVDLGVVEDLIERWTDGMIKCREGRHNFLDSMAMLRKEGKINKLTRAQAQKQPPSSAALKRLIEEGE